MKSSDAYKNRMELVQGTLARYEITATLRRPDGTTVPGRVVVTAVVGGIIIAAGRSVTNTPNPALMRLP
jgi:hypothetical protein